VRGWLKSAIALKLLHIGQFSHFFTLPLSNTYLSAHLAKKLSDWKAAYL
jgi:hypothetical protein